MPKVYTYEALIETYIQTQRKHIHPDFDTYYAALLTALEDAFDIPCSDGRIYQRDTPARAQALWQMFADAVGSYLAIRTPWETFLESGALLHRLPHWGADGQQMFAYAYRISELAKANKTLHMEMIHHLFGMMHGTVETVVTSADLHARGFDDSVEPRLEDYLTES